jgi:hypothetical protein
MKYWWLLVAAILLQGGAEAQWLNYSPSGTPMKDGKPNLSAPTPRGADGKPDLTGVWAHERTSVAEWKRLMGPAYEQETRSELLGMELEVVNKYGLNLFWDLKPGESILTPAGDAAMKRRAAAQKVDNVCHGEYGWPVAGLLAEPLKIVQSS